MLQGRWPLTYLITNTTVWNDWYYINEFKMKFVSRCLGSGETMVDGCNKSRTIPKLADYCGFLNFYWGPTTTTWQTDH